MYGRIPEIHRLSPEENSQRRVVFISGCSWTGKVQVERYSHDKSKKNKISQTALFNNKKNKLFNKVNLFSFVDISTSSTVFHTHTPSLFLSIHVFLIQAVFSHPHVKVQTNSIYILQTFLTWISTNTNNGNFIYFVLLSGRLGPG